jgi:hypothetical protein
MPELDPMESLQVVYAQALAHERTRANLTQDQLGQHPAIMVSGKLIGHVENCRRPPTERLSRGIDTALGRKRYFEALYDHWIKSEGRPPAIYEYVELETQASSAKIYNCMWITGLLQTEDYARAQLSIGQNQDRVEGLVAARMERQEILRRDPPPWLVVALDEFVLRRIVGNREIMRGQLQHLLKMMEEPNTSIVVVPPDAEVYPTGSFILLSFGDQPDLAYVEAVGGRSEVVSNRSGVQELAVMFDRIGLAALTVADSEALSLFQRDAVSRS